ncbi:MAG: FeoB-associated Cys-rich membrane protein [Suipraeoptans sp.]
MDKEQIFMAIIPAILIFCLVFFNVRKMQKNLKTMKQECGSGCGGCAHSDNCNKAEKMD